MGSDRQQLTRYQKQDDPQIPLAVKYETKPLWPDVDRVMSTGPTGAAIVLSAYEAWFIGQAVSYSRDRNWYARARHPLITYAKVVSAVDQLAADGWLIHYKQAPGPLSKWQSAFEATPKLMIAVSEMLTGKPRLRHILPNQLTIIRDENGDPMPYRPTRDIDRQDRKTASFNEAITSANVTIGGAENVVSLASPLARIFNKTTARGGRYYAGGMSWQNIPASAEKAAKGRPENADKHRQNLMIDGEKTAELDYSELHPTLLYAELGLPLTSGAYDLPGWPRKLVKTATNVMFNAPNERAALGAIAHHDTMQFMCDPGTPEAVRTARQLMQAIEEKHEPIRAAFNSDAGARLMRKDSTMAEGVMDDLTKRGIVVLPVHDSFIVQAKHRDILQSAMIDAAHKAGIRGAQISAN